MELESQGEAIEPSRYYTRIKNLHKTGGGGSRRLILMRRDYFSSSFSTIIVHLVKRAPMTPNAAI